TDSKTRWPRSSATPVDSAAPATRRWYFAEQVVSELETKRPDRARHVPGGAATRVLATPRPDSAWREIWDSPAARHEPRMSAGSTARPNNKGFASHIAASGIRRLGLRAPRQTTSPASRPT